MDEIEAILQIGTLRRFATKANDEVRTDIGMAAEACESPRKQPMFGTIVIESAPPFVDQRDDAINVWKISQQFFVKPFGDHF